MSSEMSLIEPEGILGYEKKISLKLSYDQEIIKRLIQYGGLFYMVYGVFVAYIWTCKELDAKSMNNPIVHYFWDPVIAIYSFGNISVLVMIGLSKLWSNNKEDKLTKQRHENHFIVCFIFIPLFVASCILNIIKLIRDIAVIPCHGYLTFLVPLSTLALIIGTAILIFDNEYFASNSKDLVKNLIKSHLIFFTVVGIANCFIINVALQHMNIFRKESYNSSYGNRFKFNNTCVNNSSSAQYLDSTYKSAEIYLMPIYTLFCVCTLAYLVQPLLESQSQDVKEEPEASFPSSETIVTDLSMSDEEKLLENEEESEEFLEDDGNVSYRLPSASLVFCITFLSLSFLSFIVMYSLRQKAGTVSHKNLGNLIFCIFISVVYVIGSGLSIVHIKEIKRWPISYNIRGKVIDKCLIWIGAGGQLSLSMTLISNAIILLVGKEVDRHLYGLLYMIIFSSLLVITQTFLQTIQVSLLLERKWIRPKINSLAESLCPAVGMMGLNMGLLLLSIDQLKSPILRVTSDIMFVDMFTTELGCVSETLAILQRLHASLLFASMIIYTHN